MDPKSRTDPFAELFGEFSERLRGDRWQPAIDVFESEKSICVRFELAGVRSSDVRVTVDGEVLRVTGVRTPPPDHDVLRLHQMEIAFGPFERVVRLSVPFDRDAVSAHLEEGFLTVSLPKRLPQRRRIEVER